VEDAHGGHDALLHLGVVNDGREHGDDLALAELAKDATAAALADGLCFADALAVVQALPAHGVHLRLESVHDELGGVRGARRAQHHRIEGRGCLAKGGFRIGFLAWGRGCARV
jgi:hypothetical protein